MGGYYINIHVQTKDPASVKNALVEVFGDEGFALTQENSATEVIENDDALPTDEWYGIILSGLSGDGWLSLYVDDWQDSGVIARGLSSALHAPVLEIWVADDINWGYTYYEQGQVRDRFADNPKTVSETSGEAELYQGQPAMLHSVLSAKSTEPELARILSEAHANAGQFAGPSIEALTTALGLPFEHAFTGYDYFFQDDPEDYAQDLEDWPAFRHLAFTHPTGRDQLST